MCAFQRVSEEYGKLDGEMVFPPLNKLLGHAVQSISGFEHQDIVGTGMETVRWCKEKNMVQQGYTALEETIITYCCMALGYGKKCLEKETREEGVSRAITAFRSKEELLKPECIDRCRREIIESGAEKSKEAKEIFRKTVELVPLDVIKLTLRIKERRNDINHFGMRLQSLSADKLQVNLEEDFNEFVHVKEKWGDFFEGTQELQQ